MERTIFGMLLAKIEAAYGTDPVPTAAANLIAITKSALKFDAKFEHINRSILDGTLGVTAGNNVLPQVSLSFDVEVRGNRTDGVAADISAGASGHAIEIDPLLQACDLAAAYTAESVGGARDGYVTYSPTVPTDQGKSVTFYFYTGLKLHKITGAKGTFKGTMEAGKFGLLSFSFMGLYNNASDAAIPNNPTWLNTKPPIFTSSGSTIAAYSPVFTKIDFDYGAKISPRIDANSSNGVAGFMITDRAPMVSIDPESVAEATNPVWGDLQASTARQITALIGSQTGNKFQGQFEGVSKAVAYADRSGIRTTNIDYAIERANLSDAESAAFALKFF